MVRFTFILMFGVALIFLSGCGGPSPAFEGQKVTRIAVEGVVFDVRRRGTLAEAVRRNPQYAPRMGPVGPMARQAMQQATGCRVTRIEGDAAMIVGRLACGGAAPRGGVQAAELECVPVSVLPGFDRRAADVVIACDAG